MLYRVLDNQLTNGGIQITLYASYLYDAVVLYADALTEVLDDGGSVDDGEAIVDRIRGRSYESQSTTLSAVSAYLSKLYGGFSGSAAKTVSPT